MELLWAPRGLFDEPQGMYDEERLAVLGLPEALRVTQVPDTNHFSILLGGEGIAANRDAVEPPLDARSLRLGARGRTWRGSTGAPRRRAARRPAVGVRGELGVQREQGRQQRGSQREPGQALERVERVCACLIVAIARLDDVGVFLELFRHRLHQLQDAKRILGVRKIDRHDGTQQLRRSWCVLAQDLAQPLAPPEVRQPPQGPTGRQQLGFGACAGPSPHHVVHGRAFDARLGAPVFGVGRPFAHNGAKILRRGVRPPGRQRRDEQGRAEVVLLAEIIVHDEARRGGARVRLLGGPPGGPRCVPDRRRGAAITRFGTEEQKQRCLPAIARGELAFCIGMSEPDSGSDLASITTKATRDGNGWVIEGTKIWTTGAHENDFLIVLCRTTPPDQVTDRRQGLSQLIVDLKTPRLHANPVPFIDNSADFCEVVFDAVFVPDDMVLGELGQGWNQNTSEWAFERGGPARWLSTFLIVEGFLRSLEGVQPSDAALALLGEATANYWVLHNLSMSVARSIDEGRSPTTEAALVKEMGTRFEQDMLNGVLALIDFEPNMAARSMFERLLVAATITAPSFTIRGGTNEVLRSVAAKALQTSTSVTAGGGR